jgi:ATP-dependent Clp protease protease subunit
MRMAPLRGPITERSVYYFMSRLLYLAAESPTEPILMEINSPGGLIPQSLEIIRIMNKLPCAVNTVCRGAVGGTATVIAAQGARGFRTAWPDCRFSLALGAAMTASVPGQEKGKPPVQKLVDLLIRSAAKGNAQILNWLESGAEFSAQQALDAGLIDFISSPPEKAASPPPRGR